VWIEFAVGAFQISVSNQTGPSVTWTRHVDDVQVVLLDQPIEMNVDEIQPRCGAPVPQQSWFDMFELQRLVKQRIGIEIDLPYGEVVRGTPVGMHLAQLFLG